MLFSAALERAVLFVFLIKLWVCEKIRSKSVKSREMKNLPCKAGKPCDTRRNRES